MTQRCLALLAMASWASRPVGHAAVFEERSFGLVSRAASTVSGNLIVAAPLA
jgi:hypothetical protein